MRSTKTLFHNARILASDCATFSAPTDVLVSDGVIEALGQEAQRMLNDRATQVIDVEGRWLLPGLIDAHYHLVSRSDTVLDETLIENGMIESVVNAGDCIASGVTTVRDCGCRHAGIFALRDAIEHGLVVGPNIVAAGTNPTGPSAPSNWRNVVVHGSDQMREAVQEQLAAGADWVKLILSHAHDPKDWANVDVFLSQEEIRAGVEEAHSRGVQIGCHCEGWEVAFEAVTAGMDTLEHAPLISERTAALMATRGTYYVPTVWAFSADSGIQHDSARSQDRVNTWELEHQRSVSRALEAGVRIATGTDAAGSIPGRGVIVNELEALRQCGMSRSQVLRAATVTGAEVVRRADSIGRIEIGFDADLLVADSDPLNDLTALREPRIVIKRGELAYSREYGLEEPSRSKILTATTDRW